jgi:hypothetical protein
MPKRFPKGSNAEAKIETHLASNLHKIEPDLRLVRRQFEQRNLGGKVGVIDLMCQGADGAAVVVELKAEDLGSRDIGQALAYHRLMQVRAERYGLPEPRTYCIGPSILPAAKLMLDLLHEAGVKGFSVKLLSIPAGATLQSEELTVDVHDYDPDLGGTLTVKL